MNPATESQSVLWSTTLAIDSMDKPPETGRRVREVSPRKGGGDGVAHQVASDLRHSADAMKIALDRALLRLEAIDAESSLTALVGRIAGRFREVHRDISGLASDLRSAPAGENGIRRSAR